MTNPTYSTRALQEPRHWNHTIEQATGRAFDWRCPFCGVDLNEEGYVKAHVSPVGTGIGFIPGNIVLTCNDCNVSMGDRHAWEWCKKRGISYWWMLPILETITKIFIVGGDPIITITEHHTVIPKRIISRPSKPSDKMKLAIQWFREHPEDIDLPGRYLEAERQPEGITMSHRTWNDAKKEMHHD